jgi:hypothetical protein
LISVGILFGSTNRNDRRFRLGHFLDVVVDSIDNSADGFDRGTGEPQTLPPMRILRRYIILAAAGASLSLMMPVLAEDFGNAKDIQQVRKVVAKKFGKVLHASVSHDWALCTAYSNESDLTIVLHRIGADWKVAGSDGGAYAAENLKEKGVPSADIPSLLKAYQ